MSKIHTIEVVDEILGSSSTVSALEQALRDIGVKDAEAFSTNIYTLVGDLDQKTLDEIASLVHHDVTQNSLIDQSIESSNYDFSNVEWDFAIKVDFKPGVTDNAARVLHSDLKLVGVDNSDVYTSAVHYIKGEINQDLRDQLERIASNPQIHDITILARDKFLQQNGFEKKIHPVNLGERPNFFYVDLASMSHEELLKTGKLGTLNLDFVKPGMTPKQADGIRGGTLSLAEDYMLKILEYSLSDKNTKGGNERGKLTDTELEVLAQMWSEHCRHSLYSATIPGKENGVFTEFIKKPTLEVLKRKPHLGVSIYKDNSGVFKFNDEWLVLVKNETHNSPSALDPFGGAITGIVGVNRDPAGTGIGGEVIGNFLFYFLGHPEDTRRYFKRKNIDKLEELLLNPRQIKSGVVSGVQEGGNQMGIPIELGICQYHDNYNGKPIVGVGSYGRLPININGKPSHEKHIDVGDRLYIVGGRAGRDGIHGATFSSEQLSAASPATAVQIGDPYTQRKMFEALLELRDKGYVKFVTDLGAGGVSCAAFEMAEETNGLEMDLDKLLVKYKGMTATELLLNESQERMAIAVDAKNKDEIEKILKKHEVEFSDIGMFTDSGRAVAHANNAKVVDLDMEFIHHGFPQRKLNPKEYRLANNIKQELGIDLAGLIGMSRTDNPESIRNEFYEMLKRPNLGSVADFMDKMDSTVKGLSVQHCIQGKGRVSTKASCTLVDIKSKEGMIMSYGHSERQSYIDSEKMGKNSFLRSIGHNIAMGGNLDHMIATDQALWQSSDTPEYQQMLIEANRGLAAVIEGCQIPVISGKDSMYNQATVYDEQGNVVKRGVFPTILMTTVSKIDNVDDIVTVDAKAIGDLVYIVGARTKADMGGSEFFNMYSEDLEVEYNVGQVSDESVLDVYETFRMMNNAQKAKLVQSAKYVEAGGLVTAVKETAMAGQLGIELDLDSVRQDKGLESYELMYGETEGRFLVTIKPEDQDNFERIFSGKCQCVGAVKGENLVIRKDGNLLLSESVDDMLRVYHKMEAA